MLNPKQIWSLAKAAVKSWVDDNAPSMGAALAYYTVFSIAPLLLIVISVAGLVFGQEAARGEIVVQLQGLMGEEAAKAVESMLESVSQPSKGALATIIGVVVLLIGATTVFAELQNSLDRIWRAPARESSGLWALLRSRLLSFGMILGFAFLLMASLVISAGLAALGNWATPLFGGWEFLAHAVTFLVSFGLISVIFAMIYKLMPRVDIEWRDVWIGAIVTAALFTIGKFLIGFYIGRSGVTSGYGAAGSLVVLLLWVYYSAQIFLMGAEFTWVYAHQHGSLKGQPMEGAADAVTGDAGNAGNAGAATPAPAARIDRPADASKDRSSPAKAPARAYAARGVVYPPVTDHAAALIRRDPAWGLGAAFAAGLALKVLVSLANRGAVRREGRGKLRLR